MTSSSEQKGDQRITDLYIAEVPEPTDARPGTDAKIQVMRQRFSNGESCFHKDDKTNEGIIGGDVKITHRRDM